MPRVSVLLTCYNHFAYLPQALESVRSQTFRDFEVLAIDDGSSDGTREYLAEQRDVQCIFNEQNLGTYETLNVGLRQASGEFIAVLNDDDVWHPEKLAKQVELMDAVSSVGLVHTGGRFIDGEGAVRPGNPLGFSWPTFPSEDGAPWHGSALLPLVYENKVIASAALARRVCFDELGGFNPLYFGSGDWEMWFRIAERFQIGFVAQSLTDYRVHGANASHKLERIWRDDERLREWIETRLMEGPDIAPPLLAKARAFNFAALGTVRTLNGAPAAGREAYLSSIRLDPWRWKSYLRWLATFLPPATFRRLL